jgi:hypothetical protein
VRPFDKVDTAIARWERMTKQSAVHARGGTFGEIGPPAQTTSAIF